MIKPNSNESVIQLKTAIDDFAESAYDIIDGPLDDSKSPEFIALMLEPQLKRFKMMMSNFRGSVFNFEAKAANLIVPSVNENQLRVGEVRDINARGNLVGLGVMKMCVDYQAREFEVLPCIQAEFTESEHKTLQFLMALGCCESIELVSLGPGSN